MKSGFKCCTGIRTTFKLNEVNCNPLGSGVGRTWAGQVRGVQGVQEAQGLRLVQGGLQLRGDLAPPVRQGCLVLPVYRRCQRSGARPGGPWVEQGVLPGRAGPEGVWSSTRPDSRLGTCWAGRAARTRPRHVCSLERHKAIGSVISQNAVSRDIYLRVIKLPCRPGTYLI